MKGDPKVIDFLNKALRHELTAINQYWLHYRLLDNWGLKDLAKKWRKELIEEMEHAEQARRAHHLLRRLPEHASARSPAHRPERRGDPRLRPEGRILRPRAVREGGDPLSTARRTTSRATSLRDER